MTEVLTRFLSANEVTTAKDERTLSFPFSSARPVERWAWYDDDLPEGASYIFDEILSHDKKAWNLERVKSNVCPFLKNHDRNQKLGVVTDVSFEGDRAFAMVKLRKTADADMLLVDLEDNTAGGVSFGYCVKKYRVVSAAEYEQGEDRWDIKLKKKAVLEAIEIILFEVSSEEIPADPSVGWGKKKSEHINLKTISIDGNPGWEQEESNKPKKSSHDGTVQANNDSIEVDKMATKNTEPSPDRKDMDEIVQLRSQLDDVTAQVKSFRAEIQEKDKQIENLTRSQTVKDKYSSLRKRAENLVTEAKISAAEFRDIFNDDENLDVERLLKSESEATNTELISIDFYLGKSAKRSALLNTEIKSAVEPLSERTPPAPVTPNKYGEKADKQSIEADALIRAKAIEMGLNPENGDDYARAMKAAGVTY